jgi:uncharacterized membrane protein
MARFLAAWLGAGVIVAVMDTIWLTVTNAALYRPVLGRVLIEGFRPVPAILFYALYLTGIVIFAVAPAIQAGRWWRSSIMGALFGLFCYATYDLTNQATLIVWATKITLLDLAWGTVLTATGATAGYFASKLVSRS